ncbi:coiled-coil domain-containing protein 6-like isoform X1 [Ruditapes philippinarum]|uniref:coiled-coil domain-containing protein 6-like isoform X1 n=1 Tax=Ruditapes philippinarum TaxID=129788 RepID=UPI00295BC63B|nr:coiled-coil domain-containing protein 6-like isoform X1 [Ruditapes philippinarum]
MADSASELESDTSSLDGSILPKTSANYQIEQLKKRVESLQQENRVLKVELETFKLKCKQLAEEKQELKRASVNIQARAEQEEEFISNTLLKKIQLLKKEKESLAMNYEQEEEFLTNDLSRKLTQLRQEKVELEETLEKEQEYQVNKLMRKIEKLERDTMSKQTTLEQLRREKIELENALEQEQESLVNRLWKRMDKLEAEKRLLQEKLEQPVTEPPSPREINNGDTAENLSTHIEGLRGEVTRLRRQLRSAQIEHEEKMAHYAQEERHIREENLRLQRKLQMEMERRESLCRHLSESESSLEMDDERHFNEMTKQHDISGGSGSSGHGAGSSGHIRPRTVSSPIPYVSPNSSRPLSPAGGMHPIFSPPSPMRRNTGESTSTGRSAFHPPGFGTSPPVHTSTHIPMAHSGPQRRASGDKFVRPSSYPSVDKNDKT